ncbi:MAG: cytochrome c [Bdellovibrionales bacterium]|jgi:cytochrome c551/c552|nr:cytochrome c [Bdellovibrionales bacterium]MBT3524940.1 cytochrome c [Bdellovibrionales bacterium]MBT7667940.1 cytochrome c [Bdellovibrionales bacterium]MBT7766982.1 cytochrome c [Bdellovibrionales bacterium]
MSRGFVTFVVVGLFIVITLPKVYAFNAETTFNGVCAACHSIGQGKRVGPDLKGVTKRRQQDWLIKFIKDPMGMVASDPVAKKLFDEYNKIPMPPQPTLKDGDIKAILDYIKKKSK